MKFWVGLILVSLNFGYKVQKKIRFSLIYETILILWMKIIKILDIIENGNFSVVIGKLHLSDIFLKSIISNHIGRLEELLNYYLPKFAKLCHDHKSDLYIVLMNDRIFPTRSKK